jgi:tRNA (mo5U34)-methyltransferase
MELTSSDCREDLVKQINNYYWSHSIDLGGGVVTPGRPEITKKLHLEAYNDIDFSGKKVLDIGCWDGLWSFEAEKRAAAKVYATDDVS